MVVGFLQHHGSLVILMTQENDSKETLNDSAGQVLAEHRRDKACVSYRRGGGERVETTTLEQNYESR